jgi:predicted transcriptional regulator
MRGAVKKVCFRMAERSVVNKVSFSMTKGKFQYVYRKGHSQKVNVSIAGRRRRKIIDFCMDGKGRGHKVIKTHLRKR